MASSNDISNLMGPCMPASEHRSGSGGEGRDGALGHEAGALGASRVLVGVGGAWPLFRRISPIRSNCALHGAERLAGLP
jgi:hypothetical protein